MSLYEGLSTFHVEGISLYNMLNIMIAKKKTGFLEDESAARALLGNNYEHAYCDATLIG